MINWRTICVFLAVLLPMLPGMGKVNGAEVKVELPASAAVLTNAVLQKVEYPKSEFSIEPGYGRDPFFPASTRRTAVAEPPVETSSQDQRANLTPLGQPLEYLACRAAARKKAGH